ncbi:hypothetical protein BST61_g7751 [Cercospora zeina]
MYDVLVRELLTLNIALRQRVQNIINGSKGDSLSAAIATIKATLDDPAFQMLEVFAKRAGDKYEADLCPVLNAIVNERKVENMGFTIKGVCAELVKQNKRVMKLHESALLHLWEFYRRGNVLCGEFSEAWKIYMEEIKPALLVTLPSYPPTQMMPIVTTFLSGYESKDRVKASTALPTSSNAFVERETRLSISFTTFAYGSPEDQKVILPPQRASP